MLCTKNQSPPFLHDLPRYALSSFCFSNSRGHLEPYTQIRVMLDIKVEKNERMNGDYMLLNSFVSNRLVLMYLSISLSTFRALSVPG